MNENKKTYRPLTLTEFTHARIGDLRSPKVDWLVEAKDGEPQAIRESFDEAFRVANIDAELYYDDAATCGHDRGPKYAASKLPCIVRPITAEERDQILEDGTPVLDREA